MLSSTTLLTPLAQGLLAGLAIALPLGAIGVLLVNEGLSHGWRSGAAGATGVATVDFAYCVLAVLFGSLMARSVPPGASRAVRLVGAVVMALVAVRGLLALRRPADPGGQQPAAHAFGRFVGLTAINPMTGVYFASLATSLGSIVAGPTAGAAFALGVFLGSWVWQLTLAGIGSMAHGRLPASARMVTSIIGYAVVLIFAGVLALYG